MAKKILKSIIIYILTIESRMVLKKYKPKIVAITGNVGKTSAKDAIYSVLSHAHYVRKSDKSFNSEVGIPLTILGGRNGWNNIFIWLSDIMEGLRLIFLKNHYPRWLVIEVGADRPGLIGKIASWLNPDIVVVTKIGTIPVHVEIFKTVDKLLAEKAELVKALKKDGLLVLCKDDQHTMSLKNRFSGQTATFGFSKDATLFASNERIIYDNDGRPTGINFKINYASNIVPVRLAGSLGVHNAHAVLAALSIAIYHDINLISATEWIVGYSVPPGRLNIIDGINGSIILDDSYNASPTATKAALLALEEVEATGRKIAILGDMLELGKYSAEAHREIGALAAQVCDILVVAGALARGIAQEALRKGMDKKRIHKFDTSEKAAAYIHGILKNNDIVLIKGSQGMRMERAVKILMARPEKASSLLVRQDKQWLVR